MAYDATSFWYGVVTGQQLKGWATNHQGGAFAGRLSNITVQPQTSTLVEVPAQGYYGIGSVTVVGDENLAPQNIKNGVSIFGVNGSYVPATVKLMVKNDTITENGKYTFYPSSGYDGISRHVMTVNVPVTEEVVDAKLQAKTVTPRAASQTISPDTGYDGLSSVTVSGDGDLVPSNIKKDVTIFGVTGSYINTVDALLQSKTVTPGRSGQTVRANDDYDGLSSVYIVGDSNLISSNIREGVTIFGVKGSYSSGQNYQEKTVTPTRSGTTVTADSGYNALSKVKINGDNNLTPSNIAAGQKIFGITGTYVTPMCEITVLPALDEQYIIPADGYGGFSAVKVAPAEAIGDYAEGFSAGAKSRDDEVSILQERIEALVAERDSAYNNGYETGYEDGAISVAASYKDLDEVRY